MSDLDRDRLALKQQHDTASHILDAIGHVLDQVDGTVTNLEDDSQLLPTAILRKCAEFADLVGALASQLESQSPQEREELARAIHNDVKQARQHQNQTAVMAAELDRFHRDDGLELNSWDGLEPPMTAQSQVSVEGVPGAGAGAPPYSSSPSVSSFSTAPLVSPSMEEPPQTTTSSSSLGVADLTNTTSSFSAPAPALDHDDDNNNVVQHNDILQALAGVSTLLRDVEAAFRDIGRPEAEELADVGLTLARLFLLSLQNLYDTLTPEHVVEAAQEFRQQQIQYVDDYASSPAGGMFGRRSTGILPPPSATKSRSSVVIEELLSTEYSFILDNESEIHQSKEDSSTTRNTGSDASEAKPSSSSSSSSSRSSKRKSMKNRKIRCLWPRLGPQVESIMDWTKDEAGKRPLLSVALGLTLWPLAVTTAVVGGAAVLVDSAVQDAYNHFQNGPLLTNLEQGAAQLYHTGRLSFVTGKLVTRQTVRVVSRQIERQGGVGPILDKVRDMVVDRIVHPVETAGMVWDGISWGVGLIQETAGHVTSMRQESNATAQDLVNQ